MNIILSLWLIFLYGAFAVGIAYCVLRLAVLLVVHLFYEARKDLEDRR